MQRFLASLGSLIFFVIAPGTVVGLVPLWITGWRMAPPFGGYEASRWIGALLVAIGLLPLINSFARFAWDGLGTPAPIAPPAKLVVTGFYRRVRNPMYVALVTILCGETLFFAHLGVALWALAFFLGSHLFVIAYEEPALRRQFGDQYETYRKNVPRWLPRLTAWQAL